MSSRINTSRETEEDSGSIGRERYKSEMTLQFDIGEFFRPLLSTSYESSVEDMEVNSQSMTEIDQHQGEDSVIEVIACYKETPLYPPQLVARRAMTQDTSRWKKTRSINVRPVGINRLYFYFWPVGQSSRLVYRGPSPQELCRRWPKSPDS